ncbi:MAG: metalloprotease PmbA [Burkholderiaceae bacterium]
MFQYKLAQLRQIAERALREGRSCGASAMAVELSENFGLNVSVRRQAIETIEQTRDRSLGVTVYIGKSSGHASTGDLSLAAMRETVRAAYDIARFTAADPFAGLPARASLATDVPDLDLYHPWSMTSAQAVRRALAMEQAALSVSGEIGNSDGANVSTGEGQFVLANSLGFNDGYRYTRHSMSCMPIAVRGRDMQRDYWYAVDCDPTRLAAPRAIGDYAARRALSRLGARKLSTRRAPVLFEAPLACGLLGHLAQAANGGALYRQSSFLQDTLGKQVFADHIDIDEQPHEARNLGAAPFDGEGVATRARKIVRAGMLKGYFLSSYSARKLKMRTTGNAGGSHLLTMRSRLTRPDDHFQGMLRKLGTGLLVTELMGQGVNYVTGDYSRGASGFWVENGEIQYPVEEITIAGTMPEMFLGITAVGADVIQRGGKRSGSVLIGEMAIAGS